MYVRVIYNGETKIVDNLSKLSKIQELRKRIEKDFNCPRALQRLLHRGKQLEDGHTLHDYRFGMDDVVHLMRREPFTELQPTSESLSKKEKGTEKPLEEKKVVPNLTERRSKTSDFFAKGDYVDVCDAHGAWYEALIDGIFEITTEDSFTSSDGCAYAVTYPNYPEYEITYVGLESVRLRSYRKIHPQDCVKGMKILSTYNNEKPKKRGFWYDCEIQEPFIESRTNPYIKATVFFGVEGVPVKDRKLWFLDELYIIEKNVKLTERIDNGCSDAMRKQPPRCDSCDDVLEKYCHDCSCRICKKKSRPDMILLCDDCEAGFHMDCLDPPLSQIPNEDWYCPDCKMPDDIVVKAGSNPLQNRKIKNVPAYNPKSNRDWGKGYATAGRTKECTKVSKNHFGPIPGIEVGMNWLYRIQTSEEGLHRPTVGGISGSPKEGANSIVLAGGYEEDIDEGDSFWYTGSGGRDLSGNKRTGCQTFDQSLEKYNLSIAVSCAAPVNKEKGADAGDKWKKGKPIRVIRSSKMAKHSKYAPEEGLRYDGIYKVVKYQPEIGRAGFLVWRFLFRRDDPAPPPWSEEGKLSILRNGYTCIYPPGYNKSKKRKHEDDKDDVRSTRLKLENNITYDIDLKILKLMSADSANRSIWEGFKDLKFENKLQFLNKVEEEFCCICCQDLLFKPVTTECGHNLCEGCLKRSFKCEIYSCPTCRRDLGKEYSIDLNTNLRIVLKELFPGYEIGRT